MKKKNKQSRTLKKNKHAFTLKKNKQYKYSRSKKCNKTFKKQQIGGVSKLVQILKKSSSSPVSVSPSSPVSPSSVPVSPVSVPVSHSSVPVSHSSVSVPAPARPSVSASPLPATDDLSMDVTDQTHTRMAEQYLMEANARAEQDATEAENNAKLALKNAQTAGHVPYIKPADFFQQIQDMQSLFNMGKTTSPELTFLGKIIKYSAFTALNQTPTKTNNLLYKLSINPMPPSLNASPQEYQNYLHEKANFPVSVLLRCDMENGKMQIRGVYAITSRTQLPPEHEGVKSTTTYTLSNVAKIQSKQEYDQQNAVIIQQNAEHIANLRKLTAFQKYDAEPPQDIMLKYLSPTALEQGIVPPIKATETDIIFDPDPATPAVFSNLTNYIKENNTTSYSLTRLHIYNYEAKLKTIVKNMTTNTNNTTTSKATTVKATTVKATTTATAKGGKKSRKIRKTRRRKRFTHKHNKHKPCRRNGTRRNHARKNPIQKS